MLNTIRKALHKMFEIVNKIGAKIKSVRNKNYKAFDLAFRFIELAVTILTAIFPVLLNNEFFSAAIIFFTMMSTLFFQWIVLRSKYLKEEQQWVDMCEAEINSSKKEEQQLVEMCEAEMRHNKEAYYHILKTMHDIVDAIKYQTTGLKQESYRAAKKTMKDFLAKTLTDIEDDLSNCYKTDVRASVKLLCNDGEVKTLGRGRRDIVSRGGDLLLSKKAKKQIHIDDNYAYIAVINNKLKFFAEGDLAKLRNITDEENPAFFCEYPDWFVLFKSTIIIPIRALNYDKKSTSDYDIIGLICIDAPQVIEEWNSPKLDQTSGYLIVATFADAMYSYLKEYSKKTTRHYSRNK